MGIVIGCDKNAVHMKRFLTQFLDENGIKYFDVGVNSTDDETIYPDVAERAVALITDTSNDIERGILICGTGIGMSIAANKFAGIRAAVCHDIYSTERSKLSNNANVFCVGALVIGQQTAVTLLKRWMELEFVEGPSSPKVDAIDTIERRNFKD